jgi:hypothetical protein
MSPLKIVDSLALAAMFASTLAVGSAYAYTNAPTSEVRVIARGAVETRKDEVFRAIAPGMTATEVLSRIGSPDGKMHFPLSDTTSWDYRYRDAWGYDAEFSVIMNAADIVVSKVSARLDY